MVAAAADSQHVSTPAEIRSYYEEGREDARLRSGTGLLEFARTQEILRRHLPPSPARILDVGGGSGVHSAWLARDGHEVHLVDPIELHVEQALAASRSQPEASFSAVIGDARRLREADESYDATLLLGPLYHLTSRDDRLDALREARRVIRPGGSVFAAAISRFASVMDGLARGFLLEPGFRKIVERDLIDGQHRNPTAIRGWFTTAYFHHPDELRDEVSQVGLEVVELLGIEGPGALMVGAEECWQDPAWREAMMLLGSAGHLMAVARRPVSAAGGD